MQEKLGVIIIGRNEGERLRSCILSIQGQLPCSNSVVIYVDSGSTDDSCNIARDNGIHVINLDMSTPFTAARARNTGLFYLHEHHPDIHLVQFIDGDCELIDGWLNSAITSIRANDKLAIVCGRRIEKHPKASIYNHLINLEWNTPVGEARFCGGDALARVNALVQIGGYNDELICGEEPEMCIRLRQNHWKIERIAAQMTLHDAALHRFDQWWKRAVRGGWAISEGFWMYGNSTERYMRKEHFSGWLWGLFMPLICVSLLPLTKGLSLCLLFAYPTLVARITAYRLKQGDSASTAFLFSVYCVLSKVPQMIGQAKFYWHRLQVKQPTLIEYK